MRYCIILYNFCINANQRFPKELLQQIVTNLFHNGHLTRFSKTGKDSKDVRNLIKHCIANKQIMNEIVTFLMKGNS